MYWWWGLSGYVEQVKSGNSQIRLPALKAFTEKLLIKGVTYPLC